MFRKGYIVLFLASFVWGCAEDSAPARKRSQSNGLSNSSNGKNSSQDQIPTQTGGKSGDSVPSGTNPNNQDNKPTTPNEPVVPAGCMDQDGFTFVKLLTPSISTGLITSKLTFELTWFDCQKNMRPLNGKGFMLDIEGKVSVIKTGVSMTYQFFDASGTQLSNHVLGTGTGADLASAANRDNQFYYIQSMNTGSTPGTVVFNFDYGASGLKWESASGGNGNEHNLDIIVRVQDSIAARQPVKITSP